MEQTYHTHYEIRESIIVLIIKILGMQLLMTLIHILISTTIVSHKVHDTMLGSMSGQTRELLIFHVVVTVITIYLILRRLTTYYSLHESELVCEHGIIQKNKHITKLDQNTDIGYQQRLFQRMFGFGNIILKNQYTEGETILKNIGNAEYYVKLIKQQCYQSNKQQQNIPTTI